MTTVHDILRERLLAQAGVFEPADPAPSLDEIYAMQWSPEFERLMRNRLAMGFFRYGALQKQIGCHKFDNLCSIEKRLSIYKETKNRELLVDIANLALVEFVVHPEHPFKAVDDGVHAERLKR